MTLFFGWPGLPVCMSIYIHIWHHKDFRTLSRFIKMWGGGGKLQPPPPPQIVIRRRLDRIDKNIKKTTILTQKAKDRIKKWAKRLLWLNSVNGVGLVFLNQDLDPNRQKLPCNKEKIWKVCTLKVRRLVLKFGSSQCKSKKTTLELFYCTVNFYFIFILLIH